uniref:RNA polymerase beta' subunit n=1 Tax=Kalinella pachyderma TaxID=2704665 RepID=UPI0024118E65|nr:RNA polymerase beta' subunit [Kalinella pachyderma]WDY12870.1 RNA polymerase beta' subunit [Kalinella pachyderma]
MLSSRAKRELKIDQRQVLIDSMEIGIPSAQQILVWGERRLPNGKKAGRVKNSKTVNYKRFTPFRDGLFCERIFGPVTSLVCACGKKQPHTKVTFCEKCEVQYIDQRSRRYRLGYISLVSSVTHIWYLKGRPSYLSLFLGKRKKTIMSLAYCNAYLVEHTISRTDYNAQDLQNEVLRGIAGKTNKGTWSCPCPFGAKGATVMPMPITEGERGKRGNGDAHAPSGQKGQDMGATWGLRPQSPITKEPPSSDPSGVPVALAMPHAPTGLSGVPNIVWQPVKAKPLPCVPLPLLTPSGHGMARAKLSFALMGNRAWAQKQSTKQSFVHALPFCTHAPTKKNTTSQLKLVPQIEQGHWQSLPCPFKVQGKGGRWWSAKLRFAGHKYNPVKVQGLQNEVLHTLSVPTRLTFSGKKSNVIDVRQIFKSEAKNIESFTKIRQFAYITALKIFGTGVQNEVLSVGAMPPQPVRLYKVRARLEGKTRELWGLCAPWCQFPHLPCLARSCKTKHMLATCNSMVATRWLHGGYMAATWKLRPQSPITNKAPSAQMQNARQRSLCPFLPITFVATWGLRPQSPSERGTATRSPRLMFITKHKRGLFRFHFSKWARYGQNLPMPMPLPEKYGHGHGQHLLTKRYQDKDRTRLIAFTKMHGLFLVRNKNFLKNTCQSINNFVIPKKKTNILEFEARTLTKKATHGQNKALHCTKQSFVHAFASHLSFDFGKRYKAKVQSKKGTLHGPCTDLVQLPLKDLKHTNFKPYFLKSLLNKTGSKSSMMACKDLHATYSYIRGQTFPFLPNFISNFYLRDAILNFFSTTSFFEDTPLLAYCSNKRWQPLQNVHKFMAEQTVSNLTGSQNTTLDENERHARARKKGKVCFTCKTSFCKDTAKALPLGVQNEVLQPGTVAYAPSGQKGHLPSSLECTFGATWSLVAKQPSSDQSPLPLLPRRGMGIASASFCPREICPIAARAKFKNNRHVSRVEIQLESSNVFKDNTKHHAATKVHARRSFALMFITNKALSSQVQKQTKSRTSDAHAHAPSGQKGQKWQGLQSGASSTSGNDKEGKARGQGLPCPASLRTRCPFCPEGAWARRCKCKSLHTDISQQNEVLQTRTRQKYKAKVQGKGSTLYDPSADLAQLRESVSGTMQNSAQLELTTIQEILSYTGGGALERLLSRFKTQSFEKFLFSESEILRNIYQKRRANKYKISITQDKGPYKALPCTDTYKKGCKLGNEGPSAKVTTRVRQEDKFIMCKSTLCPCHAHAPSGQKGQEGKGKTNKGTASVAPALLPLLPRRGMGIAWSPKQPLPFLIKPSSSGELHYKDLQKKQLLRLCRRIFKNARRLKIAQLFSRNNRRPEWMVLSHLPVLPPDLRPILQMSENVIVASDLNNLYQRVIYRNNRHYRLRFIDFHLVSAIQRLVQDAVDRLIENGKAGSKPYYTPGGRVLKSLSDILKGKKGRFRLNLLGKRVDFSGRSVIVVSPSCKIHECGLPKSIALELYHYFLLRQLMLKKRCSSIVIAKRMIKERSALMWDMLRDLIYHHPVLLNRAPTLHRLGIQAFQPKLVLGNAILLHPLVCSGFNADFDGDQMGVHLPLCFAARAETWDLLWSRNNLLSPATGQPMLVPSQDMVLGFYYMTQMHTNLYRHQKKSYKESANLTFVEGTGKARLLSTKLRFVAHAHREKNTKQKYVVPFAPLPRRGMGHGHYVQNFALYNAKQSFVNRHALYVTLFQHYSTIDSILQAFQKGDIFLHTPIWLKWDGKLENEGIPQKPLELRINNYGYTTSIYSNYKCMYYSTKKQLIRHKAKSVQNEVLHTVQGKDCTWWHTHKYVPWSKGTSEALLRSINSTSLYALQSDALLWPLKGPKLAGQAFDLVSNPGFSPNTFIKSIYYTNKKQRSRFIRTTVGRVILNKVMLM